MSDRKKFCAFDKDRVCDDTCMAYYKFCGDPRCARIEYIKKI